MHSSGLRPARWAATSSMNDTSSSTGAEDIGSAAQRGAIDWISTRRGALPIERVAVSSVRLAAAMASPDERLLAAASAGDAEALRAALAEGADVDAVGEDDGRSALHLAAACNSEACCRALLADADCEAEDEDGDTPPALALRAGHTSLFRLLVEEGEVENDATNAGGEGFLHVAAAAGLAEEVAWLLERGASLELKDGARRTPLHAACCAGRWAVALALLEAGADAKAVANGAQTALHFVAANASGRKGRLPVVEALLDKGECAIRCELAASSACDSVLTSPVQARMRRRAAPPPRGRWTA